MIEDERAKARGSEFALLPVNQPVVDLFLSVQTQWRVAVNGIYGLDYGAVRTDCEVLGVRLTPELYRGLKVMEFAVLEALREENRNE